MNYDFPAFAAIGGAPPLGSGRRRLYGRDVPKSVGQTVAPLSHNWAYGWKDRDWEKYFELLEKEPGTPPNQIALFIDAQILLIESVIYPTAAVMKNPRKLEAVLKKLAVPDFEPDIQLCIAWAKARAGGQFPSDDEQKDFFTRMMPSYHAMWYLLTQEWMSGIGTPALAALVLIGLDVKKISYMVGKTILNTELLSFVFKRLSPDGRSFTGWSCATYACFAIGVYYAFFNFKKLGFNIKTGAVADSTARAAAMAGRPPHGHARSARLRRRHRPAGRVADAAVPWPEGSSVRGSMRLRSRIRLTAAR